MSDTLLGLFADYGVVALFLILVFASAGVPFPSSLMLLAAGSVAAQGEIDPAQALAAAVAGAVLGDQIGYWAARWGGRRLVRRITDAVGGADKVDAAEDFARKWSGAGIFFTRWLVGALGPWINVTSGLSEYPWPRFMLWDVSGELLWVLLYGGLGYIFSDRIQAMAELLGNVSWAIAGGAATLFLGYRLYRAMKPADLSGDTDRMPDVTPSA
ncbi:DedA family protein [Sphingomonas sp. EC-HK361]|uniref:DedA family protein n=1 Tax=Sphingomonas sp. EC-HK361 TaxID=2038397 RepID=UPI0012550D9E|nr:DedA family protein [Sphingomonas sp. EC-HK361]VVT10597.1 DedA family protein [Sphingomonas sp. EC-HK361]